MNSNPMTDFFSEFRLPLNRDKQDTYAFLSEYLRYFENKLTTLLIKQRGVNELEEDIFDELRKRQETIYNFSKIILSSLKTHLDGDGLAAYRIFANQMNEMQDKLLSSSMQSSNGIINRYFRIRPYRDSEECNEPKELFHIPFEKSYLAKFCRYSVAGSPYLYLSGSPSDISILLAWLETDCPSKFYWSEFIFSNHQKKIELLDFTWSPFSNAMKAGNYRTWILNKEPFVKNLLVDYVSTYPLLASCSLKAFEQNRQSKIPEYVIPQMLLEWIGSTGKYRGIKYYSCSRFNESKKYNAFNVVLAPQRGTLRTGYCPRLKCEFKVSTPKLMEVSDIRQLEEINIDINPNEFEFIDKSCQETQ